MNKQKMSIAQIAFLVAAIYETLLAIPIIGGTAIVVSGWGALQVAFVIHLVALVLALVLTPRAPIAGSVWGIVTSFVGVVPVIGWALHVITALINYAQAFGKLDIDEKVKTALKDEEAGKEEENIKDAEIVDEDKK